MDSDRMDVDAPEVRVAAAAAVPATPPQSNNNTPQRDAVPAARNNRNNNNNSDTEVGAELQREESRRQVDSAVPESPPVHATAGNDNDAFAEEMDEEPSTHNRTARALEMKSKRITEKLRGRSRGRGKASAEYESDKEEGQKIEHGDFFNSFGEKWDSPM